MEDDAEKPTTNLPARAPHAEAARALTQQVGLGVMDGKGYGYWEDMREQDVVALVATLRQLGWRIEEPTTA